MRNIRYILNIIGLVGLCWTLSTCDMAHTGDDDIAVLPEGTEVEVTFGGFMNEAGSMGLRSTNADEELDDIKNLRLLVFDESGNFIYSRKAVLSSQIVAPDGDQSYLPKGKDGILKVYTYSTKLLSSTKKRIIHFIANHDWSEYTQDYYLAGKSEGELIPALTTNQTEFWRRVELNGLNAGSLQGKVVKLLRNQAKISIEYNNSAFEITNAWVYNAYEKGTVAPYTYTKDLAYSFPDKPELPTIPAGVTVQNVPFAKVGNAYEAEVFEHRNEEAAPLFVIIEVASKYFKIDLKKTDATTGITSLHDLVRNYWYKILVKEILADGYASADEAAMNPAGNNLLASVELEKYPAISTGTHSLSVGHIEAVYTKLPAEFKTTINYSEGADKVKVTGLWEQDIEGEYIETMKYESGTGNEGQLTIQFEKLPKDETIKLQVAVVARPSEESPDIISRTITITLRPPYTFNAELESAIEGETTAGSELTLSFDVPQTIPASLFPFAIWIKTKELTPLPGQNVSFEIKDGDYYVRYWATEASRGNRVELKFKRNIDGATEDIKLLSDYYEIGTVELK